MMRARFRRAMKERRHTTMDSRRLDRAAAERWEAGAQAVPALGDYVAATEPEPRAPKVSQR